MILKEKQSNIQQLDQDNLQTIESLKKPVYFYHELDKTYIDSAALLYMQVFNAGGEEWSLQQCLNHIEENNNPKYSYVVIHKKKVVGLLVASVVTWEQSRALLIDTLVVSSDHRQRGIGTFLLERVTNKAKSAEFNSIKLLANPDWDSYEWYRKAGYQKTGWVEMYKVIRD